MTLTYKIGNIFDIPLGWDIVHCVTADFSCGAGIAKELNERCNLKEKFEAQHFSTDIVGSCVKIDNIFNLLTKQNRYSKVSYEDLTNCLYHMADMILGAHYNIAMPKIGCGRDGLSWDIVVDIIKEVFENMDVDFVVYVLSEEDIPDERIEETDDEIDNTSPYLISQEEAIENAERWAVSHNALILEKDDVLFDEEDDFMLFIDSSIFDPGKESIGTEIYIYILGETDVGSYEIVNVTKDGTYCKYLGDARK